MAKPAKKKQPATMPQGKLNGAFNRLLKNSGFRLNNMRSFFGGTKASEAVWNGR
jgi:hypothetical protein